MLQNPLYVCSAAPCVANIQSAIEHIFPLVSEYQMERARVDAYEMQTTERYLHQGGSGLSHRAAYRDSFRYKRSRQQRDEDSEEYSGEEEDSYEEDFDSDMSED